MKKSFLTCLTLVVLCLFTACEKKEPVIINVMITGYGDIDAADVYVFKKYQEKSGVQVNWTTVKKDKRKEEVYLTLSNRQQCDLIMRCKVSANLLTQYGEKGYILDLAKDNLLQTYAPNCWSYLQSHPDTLASVMNPDGSIYGLPQVNSGAELRVSRKLFVNKKWLENVNMELPTTTDELYKLLKAFKEQDANGNGDKDDEIPFCTQDWISYQEALFGAFGLGNRGVHNVVVDYDEEKDAVRLIASTDRYKAFLEYTNKLYAEGLIDKYIFTTTINQWLNNANYDRIGVFANTNLATLPSELVDNWVAIDEALEGPFGDKLWSPIRANFHSTGAALIPSTCTNPGLVLQWLDYFWTDEGTLFYHMGVEGETYVKNADGSYDYSPSIYAEIASGAGSFDDIIAKYSPYPGGSNPTIEISPYFRGGETAPVPAEAARKLMNYGPSVYWPSFTFTTDENERLTIIQSDIEKYINSMRIDFISGVKSFSEWQEYLDNLDKLGKEELLEIYQVAVNRYNDLLAK